MSSLDQTIVNQPTTTTEQATIYNLQSGISLWESFSIAAAQLAANKLRTVLTALGVIIGVTAVVALLAIGKGSQEKITESITASGANLLTVRADMSRSGGEGESLTLQDAEALADPANVPAASKVSAEYMNIGNLVTKESNLTTLVFGVTPDYAAVHNNQLASGEFITQADVDRSANVAVLGAKAASTLFGEADPIGQKMRINGQSFRVVGVLKNQGGNSFGSADNSALVPLTTMTRKLSGARVASASGKTAVSSIAVQAKDQASIEQAQAQIAATLRQRHNLPMQGGADNFSVDNQQSLIDTFTESSRTMTLYLGAIALISLIVGGIGIMNIMLVSVRERTREIGLRKAVGARERDILTQFLCESLALSTGGGLVGVGLGVLIAVVVNATGQSRASVSIESVVLAVGFALAVGLFFGIEPARRAARLDPIEALRYE